MGIILKIKTLFHNIKAKSIGKIISTIDSLKLDEGGAK